MKIVIKETIERITEIEIELPYYTKSGIIFSGLTKIRIAFAFLKIHHADLV